MQCPLCGNDVLDLRHGLCPSCGAAKRPFLETPDIVDVTRCSHCGRLERRGTWMLAPGDDETVSRLALDEAVDIDPDLAAPQLRSEFRWEDPKNAVVQVRLEGQYLEHPVEREAEVRIRLKIGSCNDCSRKYGGYFEAIVQVRGSDERVLRDRSDSILAQITKDVERYRLEHRTGAYISRSDRVKGGFDLYFGNQEIARLVARNLADKFGAEYAESAKLVGRKDGADLFRFTLLVRLPAYLPGDFIALEERPYKVMRIDRKRLTLWDLERRERIQKETRFFKKLKVIGRIEDEQEAVVVSRFSDRLQILDPKTYQTVDVPVKPDEPIADTVRVFRHEDVTYLIPTPDSST